MTTTQTPAASAPVARLGAYAVNDIVRTKTGRLDAIVTELHPRSTREEIAAAEANPWLNAVQRSDEVAYRVMKDGKAWGPTRRAKIETLRMVRSAPAPVVEAPAPVEPAPAVADDRDRVLAMVTSALATYRATLATDTGTRVEFDVEAIVDELREDLTYGQIADDMLTGGMKAFWLAVDKHTSQESAVEAVEDKPAALTGPFTIDDFAVGDIITTATGRFFGRVDRVIRAHTPEEIAIRQATPGAYWCTHDALTYHTVRDGNTFGPVRHTTPAKVRSRTPKASI